MESLLGLLPFGLIALVCPLAMIFMMRGMHGGHGKHEDHATSNTEPDRATATRLAAMEQEITRLRGELLAAGSVETRVRGRHDGRLTTSSNRRVEARKRGRPRGTGSSSRQVLMPRAR